VRRIQHAIPHTLLLKSMKVVEPPGVISWSGCVTSYDREQRAFVQIMKTAMKKSDGYDSRLGSLLIKQTRECSAHLPVSSS
jgi:hypothetical protein